MRQWHHLGFERVMWEAGTKRTRGGKIDSKGYMHRVRDNKWLIIPIDSEAHTALHADVPFVPVPGYKVAKKIHEDFYPVRGDYLATIHSLIQTIDELGSHYQVPTIERGYCQLACDALERQLPYIVEGLIIDHDK